MIDRIYAVRSGLPDLPSVPDPQLQALVVPIYQAVNGLAKQVSDLTGATIVQGDALQNSGIADGYQVGGINSLVLEAAVAIGYGQLINLTGDTPTAKVRLADVSLGRRAHGVCVQPGGIAVGKRGRVRLSSGLLTGFSGITPGNMYWQGNAGALSGASLGGSPYSNPIAVGISTTAVYFNIVWHA